MRCLWCSNPESQKSVPELGFIESRCDGVSECGISCASVCSPGAIALGPQGIPEIDRSRCDACGECASVCPQNALKIVGQEMTVDEVLVEIEKDRPFFRRSGGGVTIGGGEPLAQYRFTAALLEACQEAYLHTAIETCGHAPWHHLEPVLRYVDLLQFDLKHMDPERHRELTGQSNDVILDNLRRVLSVKAPQDVIIRIPVIPGCNDSTENIAGIASFVADLGFAQIELIPYHRLGTSKYAQYGMAYPLAEPAPEPQTNLDDLRRIVEDCGLDEVTGSV